MKTQEITNLYKILLEKSPKKTRKMLLVSLDKNKNGLFKYLKWSKLKLPK